MTSFFFAGNKIDRDDVEIPTEVGDEFAQRHGMYFLETSAKASDNVERLFTEIAQDLLQVSAFGCWKLQTSRSPRVCRCDKACIFKRTLRLR